MLAVFCLYLQYCKGVRVSRRLCSLPFGECNTKPKLAAADTKALRRHKLHIAHFRVGTRKNTHSTAPPFPKKLTLFGDPDLFVVLDKTVKTIVCFICSCDLDKCPEIEFYICFDSLLSLLFFS